MSKPRSAKTAHQAAPSSGPKPEPASLSITSAPPPPTEPVPTKPAKCQDCEFWAGVDADSDPAPLVGQCRYGPPDHPTEHFHKLGRIYTFRLTFADTPMCSGFIAKRAGRTPV